LVVVFGAMAVVALVDGDDSAWLILPAIIRRNLVAISSAVASGVRKCRDND
jgi:hypothetical protein